MANTYVNKVQLADGTSLIDISSDTVTADKLMQGYTAHDRTGALITGTATGGGSVTQDQDGFIVLPPTGGSTPSVSGLEYETGTWTPSEDVAEAWIPFTNTHTEAPFCYSIIATEYTNSDSSNGGTDYINYAQIIGEPFRIGTSTSSVRYGAARKLIRSGGSTQSSITYPHTNTGDSTTSYSRYWAKETGIRAAQYSTGYYWRAGITYKWMAVWAPTT